MLRLEFLSYSLEDRASVFLDNIELPVDVLVRDKNLVKNLDMKDLCDFDKSMLCLDRETVDGIGLLETVFPYGMRKSVLDSPCLGVSSDEMSDNSINKVPSTSIINLDHFTQELGFGAENSGTAFEPNNEKESMIDLKLEKCTDSKEVSSMLRSEESLVSSLVEDSLPAKRARTTNLYSQIPICQVQGCYKDLSFSKVYHKRHRVCDIHSKTAKVIINGIEQRFCQQCSRFHLLGEFDGGKRSCRKRLAGHNERRRKPQLGAHLGSRFFEMTLLKSASFLSPETLPGSFYYQERNVSYNHSKHIKSEQAPIDISQLALPATWQSPQKSLANLLIIRNQHHSKTCNDAAVEVELPMLLDSHCALSLLSAKSHKSSSLSTGISMTPPPSTRENHDARIGVDQKSAKQPETVTIKSFAGNRHFSPWTRNQAGSPMVHDSRAAVCSEVQKDGFLQISDYNNCTCCISSEVGCTVDLLQLSSNFQRVEQLRNSMQMKPENYTFC